MTGTFNLKAMAMFMLAVLVAVSAAGAIYENAYGEESDAAYSTYGPNLTHSVNGTVLTITGNGPMYNFSTSTAYRAPYYGNGSITQIVVDEGVTSVGSTAFYAMSALTRVTLASSVESIESNAFYGCTQMTRLYSYNPDCPTFYNSSLNIGTNAVVSLRLYSEYAFTPTTAMTGSYTTVTKYAVPVNTAVFSVAGGSVADDKVAYSGSKDIVLPTITMGSSYDSSEFRTAWFTDSALSDDCFVGYPGDTYTLSSDVTLYGGLKGTLSFTSETTLEAISLATFSYTPTTNLSSTITKYSGDSWLSWNPTSKTISGTVPNVSSITTYQFVLRAQSDVDDQVEYQSFEFKVFPAMKAMGVRDLYEIETKAMVQQTYTSNIAVMSWSHSGTLPSGMSFSTAGVLTGTPASGTHGTYSVTLSAISGEGPSQTSSIVISILVKEVVDITSPATVNDVWVGYSYEYVPASNIDDDTVWSISDGPGWLVYDPETGKVRGTPPPASYSEATSVTFVLRIDCTYPTQSDTQLVTLNLRVELVFTSIPTAAMVVQPVYGYGSGTGIPALSTMVSAESVEIARTAAYRFVFVGDQAETVHWDFGDGTESTEWTPTHIYAGSGVYTVTCTAYNEFGEASTVKEVTVVIDDLSAWFLEYFPWIAMTVGAMAILLVTLALRRSRTRRLP